MLGQAFSIVFAHLLFVGLVLGEVRIFSVVQAIVLGIPKRKVRQCFYGNLTGFVESQIIYPLGKVGPVLDALLVMIPDIDDVIYSFGWHALRRYAVRQKLR